MSGSTRETTLSGDTSTGFPSQDVRVAWIFTNYRPEQRSGSGSLAQPHTLRASAAALLWAIVFGGVANFCLACGGLSGRQGRFLDDEALRPHASLELRPDWDGVFAYDLK